MSTARYLRSIIKILSSKVNHAFEMRKFTHEFLCSFNMSNQECKTQVNSNIVNSVAEMKKYEVQVRIYNIGAYMYVRISKIHYSMMKLFGKENNISYLYCIGKKPRDL